MPSDALKEHLQKRPEYRNTSKARLAYLYSDLSQARTTNPTSYTSSVAWWSNLIHDLVSQGLQSGGGEEQTDLDADQVTRGKSPSSKTSNDYSDKIIWHLDQAFVDRLRWEGAGRPTGLGTVTLQLAQATPPQLVPLSTFLSSTRPIEHFSWPRWILSNLVSAPLWWSLGKMGLTENGSGMSEAKSWQFAQGDWVMMETLKKASESFARQLGGKTSILDRLFTVQTFTEAFADKLLPGGVRLTSQDLKVLLKYLQRDRGMLVVDGETIKVLNPLDQEPQSVSEADKGILQVKTTSSALEAQIADLEDRIAERQDKIASYIRKNQKDLALSHLRSKKALLDLLSKRTMASENLSAVMLKIEAAESDAAILQAYQSATTSLKSLLAHPSMQRDNVENTMEALQDVLADQKEIEDVVTEGGRTISGTDLVEDEIQAELDAMQKEAEEEQRKKQDQARLEKEHATKSPTTEAQKETGIADGQGHGQTTTDKAETGDAESEQKSEATKEAVPA